MPGDPFLNYLALGLLIFVVLVLFYGIIAIHDIPAKIAASRHHPHEDAIHAAGWVSLFMLHALWPFLWIWAMSYQPERGWGFSHKPVESTSSAGSAPELEELKRRLAEIGHKPGEPSLSAEAVAEFDALKRRLAEIEARLGIGGP
jgi:hypothetical protein